MTRSETREAAVRTVLEDASSMTVARAFAVAMAVVQGFVVPRLLPPAKFGLVNLITLIGFYVAMISPGVRDVAQQEIPYYASRGEIDRMQRVKNVAFTVDIGWRLAASLLLAIGALAMVGDPVLRIGLALAAASLTLFRMQELYALTCQITRSFQILSRGIILTALLTIALVVPAVLAIGVYGPVIVQGMVAFMMILFYRRHVRLEARPEFSWSELRRMLRVGIPLQLITLVYWLYRNVDNMVVVKVRGTRALGYYGLAFYVASFVVVFWSEVAGVIQPRLYAALGERDPIEVAQRYVVRATLLYACAAAGIVGLLWTGVPLLIRVALPKYLPSIPVVRVAGLTVFFAAVVMMPSILLYSPKVRRQVACVVVWSAAAVTTGALSSIFLTRGWDLTSAAWASVAGHAVATVLVFAVSYRYCFERANIAFRFYLTLLAPAAWAAASIAVAETVASTVRVALLPTEVVRAGLFCLLYAPFAVWYGRRLNLTPTLKGLLVRRPMAALRPAEAESQRRWP